MGRRLRRMAMLGWLVAALAAGPSAAQNAPYQREARQIFERLIAFHTSAGQGQVPAMAGYIEQILRNSGVPAGDIVMLPHEEASAMLVRVPGRDALARPILFSSLIGSST